MGCPVLHDCNDASGAVSPARLEDGLALGDEDCNGRVGVVRPYTDSYFPAGQWVDTGTVTHGVDTLTVGSPTSGASSSTRTLSIGLSTGVAAVVNVDAQSGSACALAVTLQKPLGVPVVTTLSLSGGGTPILDLSGASSPPDALTKLKISCPALSSVTVDWLQIQDSLEIFPPALELSLEWGDTRTPAGGFETAVMRDDQYDWLYMGSDVGGVARYEVSTNGPWETANGTGTDTLFAGQDPTTGAIEGGVLGVADILPMTDGTHGLYALLGHSANHAPVVGGLWYSGNRGDQWHSLGSSWDDTVNAGAAGVPRHDTTDDVAGYGKVSNCGTDEFGGGRMLQGDDPFLVVAPDTVYIANADEDALGVSIWDGSQVCAMPTAPGAGLPADKVGAILRVDTPEYATPLLVVGYRGRDSGGTGLYVCELPAGGGFAPRLSCGGAAQASCQPVDGVGVDSFGVDVRDLEVDPVLSDDGSGDLGIFVADGGNRPPADCGYASSELGELVVSDSGSAVLSEYTRGVVGPFELPALSTGTDPLTGVSVDPDGAYVFVNVPVTPGAAYHEDRMYRARALDLYLTTWGMGSVDWEAVNSGDSATAYDEEDPYEHIRRVSDSDYGGTWKEAVISGRADPFPARSSPGKSIDATWFVDGAGTNWAVLFANNEAWLTWGLEQPWTDNEGWAESVPDTVSQPEGDVEFTFWPDLDLAGDRSYQSLVTYDVAVDDAGQFWSANADVGVVQMDGTDPTLGAQIDCLWSGWHAAASSISVSEMDGSVWATVMGEGAYNGGAVATYPYIGVLRTTDEGDNWDFAGAGYLDGTTQIMSTVVEDPRVRACRDHDVSDLAFPFASWNGIAWSYGTTAFADPASVPATDAAQQSLGQPKQVEAINAASAMVMITAVGDYTSSYETDGGLLFTVDGGVTWKQVPFDGAWSNASPALSGTCDAQTTWRYGRFALVHPGTTSYWHGTASAPTSDAEFFGPPVSEGDPPTTLTHDYVTYTPDPVDPYHFDLVVALEENLNGPADGSYGSDPALADTEFCSLARVSVSPGAAGTVTATWQWIPLTKNKWDPYACGVYSDNIAGITVPPWSDDLVLWGNYQRAIGGAFQRHLGGVCTMNLSTQALTQILNPVAAQYSIAAVAPHPEIADLFAVIPKFDGADFSVCHTFDTTGAPGLCTSYPWASLLWANGSTWTKRTLASDQVPTSRSYAAAWSHTGIPGEPGNSAGDSWLMVGTSGDGSWRGRVTW